MNLYFLVEYDPKKFTTAEFHYDYLVQMFKEKGNKMYRYSKNHTKHVQKKTYVDALQKRISDTDHLNSLRHFFDFCVEIKRKITPANGESTNVQMD